MKFRIHLDDLEHQVEAAADGTLVVDGERFQVKVSSTAGDKRTVQVGDKTYEVRLVKRAVEVSETGASYVLEISGERIPVTVIEVAKNAAVTGASPAGAPESAGSVAAQTSTGPAPAVGEGGPEGAAKTPAEVREGIWAPVPGKIVDVFVKVGDTVKEGDLVLILEAMKMENELHAAKQAAVTAVLVKKGDQAERGQLLVAFE